jgi:hypothetical protein
VPEQLGLDHALLERGAEHRHERPLLPRAGVMQDPREQVLSGSGLAEQQHRILGLRRPSHRVLQIPDDGRAADEPAERPVPGQELTVVAQLTLGSLRRVPQIDVLANHALPGPKSFEGRAGDLEEGGQHGLVGFGEVAGVVILEVHQRGDPVSDPDRGAQNGGHAEVPD